MKEKQNIPALLLLFLWAVMFCFSVSFTLHKLPESISYTSCSTAGQHKESVATEDQGSPVAWTEPSVSQTIAGAEEPPIQVYTLLFRSFQPALNFTSPKPGKATLTPSVAIMRYLVQPNAP